jgi:hypothetical protein
MIRFLVSMPAVAGEGIETNELEMSLKPLCDECQQR